jgi:hypothetical protein
LGLDEGLDDESRRLLTGFVVVGGRSHGMSLGTRLHLLLLSDRLIMSTDGGASATGYDQIKHLETSGRGRITSGGGFIGGGFGLPAAAEGMAIAGVLNSLSTKTQMETFLDIVTAPWHVVLATETMTPHELRLNVIPAQQRIAERAAATTTPETQANADPVEQLQRLAALHEKGALDADEYNAAKQRIIDRM